MCRASVYAHTVGVIKTLGTKRTENFAVTRISAKNHICTAHWEATDRSRFTLGDAGVESKHLHTLPANAPSLSFSPSTFEILLRWTGDKGGVQPFDPALAGKGPGCLLKPCLTKQQQRRSPCIFQTVLKLRILLLQHPKCWEHRHGPSYLIPF